jgi:hypothetical protein
MSGVPMLPLSRSAAIGARTLSHAQGVSKAAGAWLGVGLLKIIMKGHTPA